MFEKKEKNKITKVVRRHRIIAFKGEGREIEDIAKELGVSEKTVDRDLKSVDVQAFSDELTRRQLVDIEKAPLKVRLQYRSDLLDKLLPRKPAVNVDVNVNQNQTASRVPVVDLSKLSEDDRKALLHAEEALTRAEKAAGPG